MLTIMQKLNNITNERRIRISNIAFYATVITMIGLFFLSYNYVLAKKIMVHDYVNSKYFTSSEEIKVEIENIEEKKEIVKEERVEESNTSTYDNTYIGYLKIPKIGFEKGFVDKESPENDVEKNIFVADISSYPDIQKGNLVIAGHSGTGWKAFFNDLYKLNINDQAIVNYKNHDYVYKLVDIYRTEKSGTVKIYRNTNKTTLTLITCTNNDSATQTVYIFELM